MATFGEGEGDAGGDGDGKGGIEDCDTSECRFLLLLKRGNRRLVLDREKEGEDVVEWPSAELLDLLRGMLGQCRGNPFP